MNRVTVFGRKILEHYNERHPLDVDEIVFSVKGQEIVVSLYRAETSGVIEVRCNSGLLAVYPRAANLIEVGPHK